MQLHSSSSFAPPSLLHTHPHKRPMHSHAAVMEKNIHRQNQDGLIIPKHTFNARVFTLGGNPFSCYSSSSITFFFSFYYMVNWSNYLYELWVITQFMFVAILPLFLINFFITNLNPYNNCLLRSNF
jgi:hypothetical protein